jgi:uncharacterized protein HemY
MDEREKKYLEMVAECPESPLGHFSLGKYYVEVGRFREAAEHLGRCLTEEPCWAAAMVALADAYSGLGEAQKAIAVLRNAKETVLARSHPSIAKEIRRRLESLETSGG